MKKEDLSSCQFSNWYPHFEKYTVKSRVLPLPQDFIEYLKDDGTLLMPKGVELATAPTDKDWDEDSWEDNTEEVEEQPDFEDLIREIKDTLSELGGNAFPKLNWSAPKDAMWINNNTLKCSSPGEIILLLKSSDFVQYDLASIFKKCEDANEADIQKQELVLRKWANLSPGMEFRCFIRNKRLIGISQRDWRQYFDFIEAEKGSLVLEMQKFIQDKILQQFPSRNFVVDLYKKKSGRYWIIDFNPFNEVTDSLLFTWEELYAAQFSEYPASINILVDGQVTGQFRCADKNTILQPSESLSHRIPTDFLHLSTGADATKLVDFMRMKIQGQDGEYSSDSEDEEWRLPR